MDVQTAKPTTAYLTYRLADEVFALDITKVREVLDFTTATKVPNMPEYVRGVINLRGSAVPVVDLRKKFGMAEAENSIHACVIIAEVDLRGETVVLGALADAVHEVVDLETGQIESPPKIGTELRADFVQGMGKYGDRFIIILDIDKVFSATELDIGEASDAGGAGPRAEPTASPGAAGRAAWS